MAQSSNPILLTGATGFIGSNLAAHLLLTTKAQVFCLVRAPNAQERLIQAVRAAARAAALDDQILPQLNRLTAIAADLTQPQLGLGSAQWRVLQSAGVAQLWHCAASLRFEPRHRADIFERNVMGTQRVLDLAAALQISQFNAMSTAYVAGKCSGLVAEQPVAHHAAPNNDYEASKRQAENRLLNAHQQGTFQVNIFRPSIVIGNSTTYDSTSDSGLYGFVAAVEQFRQQLRLNGSYVQHCLLRVHTPDGTTSGLNLMPIDRLLHEAIALAQSPTPSQVVYHLSNPFLVSLESLQHALTSIYPDLELQGVRELSELQPVDRLFHRRLRFYHPYLHDTKQFERRRDAHPPADLRLTVPQLERYLQRFITRFRWRNAAPPDEIAV
ncbi:MAG: SDR family oxidoreductase [Kaiparowitsia implicata GSE-PSE-MK54-09C]|jgi:thioester reductase-like protein|nr:SDR family oxidoreductase [Kaiparowitsia implicata GSE-PSE-MK54-09C]